MLRTRLNEALKAAMLGKNARGVSTIRLILAALKDRDIAARERGVTDGISEGEIAAMLQQMVKQRRDSIVQYEQGGRLELAQQEREEITVIEGFMPRQLDDAETQAAVLALIQETGATGIKDMGAVMAELRNRFVGQMDFARAGSIVKDKLGR